MARKSNPERAARRSAARVVADGVAAAAGGVVAATFAAGIVMSPAQAPQARLGGIHEDLQRAVALQQITPEQAALFEVKLQREILRDTSDDESPA
ncbi:hypothetical protein [Sinomonas susongensis]|uniref:hypothetical protein n=1 Tax=Sinomonas susongensis TaxID=1324851 RepID=UPI001FEC5C20|nr:hypothetical protein [Sinomonas susongensis]